MSEVSNTEGAEKPLSLEEAETVKKEVVKAVKADIMVNENGLLLGKSLGEMHRIAVMMVVSKMVPKQYDTPEKLIVGWQFAQSLNLNPFVAIRQIALINGVPSLFGDLPLGLARRTGKLKYFREFEIDEKYNEIRIENKNLHVTMWACACTIEREGMERKTYTFTQIDYAKQGGQVKAIWDKYEKTMFMRKARGLGLKAEFSDVLEGVIIAEYDFNIIPEEGGSYKINHDGTESQESKAEKFKQKLNNKPDIEAKVMEKENVKNDPTKFTTNDIPWGDDGKV